MRMRFFLLPLALLAAALGYYVYWNEVADRARLAMLRWVDQRRAAGFEIQHGALRIGGFPYRIEIEVAAPLIADPDAPQAWRWQGEQVRGILQPWNLRHLILEFPGEHRVDWRENGRARFAAGRAGQARASLVFDGAGRWDRIAGEAAALDLATDLGPVSAVRAELHVRHSPTSADDVDVAVEVQNLQLPEDSVPAPMGRTVTRARAIGMVAGPWPAGPFASALERWRDEGGAVELRSVEVKWAAFELQGDGTLTLDKEMRPLAALATEVKGYGALLETLAAAGRMRASDARTARFALDLLAKNGDDGRRALSVPVSAQDGRLFLGPVAVLRLAPVLSAASPPPSSPPSSSPGPASPDSGQSPPR